MTSSNDKFMMYKWFNFQLYSLDEHAILIYLGSTYILNH